jgi:hypothetical protein
MSAETHPKAADAYILTSLVSPASWITYTRPKAFLREHIFDTWKVELTSSLPSEPSRGTQYAKAFLDDVPGEGGSSNFREVRVPTLQSPVATLRATYRPIEIVPSVCTVGHSL